MAGERGAANMYGLNWHPSDQAESKCRLSKSENYKIHQLHKCQPILDTDYYDKWFVLLQLFSVVKSC